MGRRSAKKGINGRELAEKLGVSPHWVYRRGRTYKEDLPACYDRRKGDEYDFPIEAVEAWEAYEKDRRAQSRDDLWSMRKRDDEDLSLLRRWRGWDACYRGNARLRLLVERGYDDQVVDDRHTLLLDRVVTEADVRKAFASIPLRERSRTVISMRYGFDPEHGDRLHEIAEVLGMTRENVRQVEFRTLDRLRQRAHLFEGYDSEADSQACRHRKKLAHQAEIEEWHRRRVATIISWESPAPCWEVFLKWLVSEDNPTVNAASSHFRIPLSDAQWMFRTCAEAAAAAQESGDG